MDRSCVIPVYNAESVVDESLRRLHAHLSSGPEFEILVVDDGSEDQTAQVSERALRELGPRHRLLRHPRNLGKGAAVRCGMLAARGRAVAFTDADLPYDLSFLPQAFALIEEDRADVVIGDRNLPESVLQIEPSVGRRLASLAVTVLVSTFITPGLRDTQCGIKAFARAVIPQLFENLRVQGFAFDIDVLQRATRQRLTIERLPVCLTHQGPSTIRLLRHGPQVLGDLLRLWTARSHGDDRSRTGADSRPPTSCSER
jgi:glycosyltransferase involved in cell wall biosynthesis